MKMHYAARYSLTVSLMLLYCTEQALAGEVASGSDNPSDTSQGSASKTAVPEVQLAEIIITVEKRSESLQSAPASVTVLSGEDLTESGTATGDRFMAQALQNVPGVAVENGNVEIRGVSTNTQTNTFAPATATYVDGVYSPLGGAGYGTAGPGGVGGYGATGANLDTRAVEVLRGPQGTLFGRSATGGVVNVTTNDPADELMGKASVELGNYGLRHESAVANVPLNNDVAIRGAFDDVDRDGYFNNGAGDDHDQQLRLKGRFQDGSLRVVAAAYYERFGEGFGPGGTAPYTAEPTEKYIANGAAVYRKPSSLWMFSGRVDLDLGFATATLIPSYGTQRTSDQVQNLPVTSILYRYPELRSHYEELRLASRPDSKLIWVIGGNYIEHDSVSRTTATALGTSLVLLEDDDNIVSKSKGVFGQATYPLTSSLGLTAGLRYTRETIDQLKTGGNPTPADPTVLIPVDITYKGTFVSTNYKAGIQYSVGPSHLLYGNVATGFRPGGLSRISGQPFEAETVTSYEIGSKNLLFDRRWQLNGSLYYYDYPQYQTGIVEYLPNGVPYVSIVTLPATYKGGDLESLLALTRADTLTLSIAYLDAAFTRLDPATAGFFGGTGLASAPRWQVAADLRHTFSLPGGADLTADVRTAYRSSSYVAFPLDPRLRQQGYALADLSLTFTPANPHFSITAYLRNLTNEYYKVGGTMALGVASPNDLLQVGIPRTLGVVLNMSF